MHQQFLQIVTRQFGLQVIEQHSPVVVPRPTSCPQLSARLQANVGFIHSNTNEKTRAEMIVAPILIHLAVTYQLSLYSGNAFNVNLKRGLSGTVDHLLSRATPPQSTISPPIAATVETKSSNRGISHCLTQVITAQQFNANLNVVYGIVTTGVMWQFFKLEGTIVTIDRTNYPLFPIDQLLSLLVPIVR